MKIWLPFIGKMDVKRVFIGYLVLTGGRFDYLNNSNSFLGDLQILKDESRQQDNELRESGLLPRASAEGRCYVSERIPTSLLTNVGLFAHAPRD